MIKTLRQSLLAVAATILVATAGLYLFSADVLADERPASANEEEEAHGEDEADELQARPAADGVLVNYHGTLQNQEGQPVSGVFPLTFHLYRGSMSAEPVWSEAHFVSVVDGRYQVPLGARTALGEHLLRGERWVGIELDGETEILRDRINIERPDDGLDEDSEPGSDVSHSGVAERALMADDAMALDGMTAEEIEDMANLAMRRLGEHIADPDAHDAVKGPRIGSPSRAADEQAGGSGGSPYDIRCPDGHVVTGITGGAGRLVDNITVVCSPLE